MYLQCNALMRITWSGGNLESGSLAAVRAAVCKAEREEWSRGESNVAELRNFQGGWL